MKKIFIYSIFIITIWTISGCSGFQKLLKSNDYNLVYNEAVKYYEKKDYFRAQSLFENLENIFKASDKADKILHYLGYCYYYQRDYIMASYYFKNVGNRYPLSPLREESDFMAAYCAYLDAPDFSLDQTYTYQAIDQMQAFINRYPKSTKIAQCNEIIDKLRLKLETKSFEAAKLYYKTGYYQSAIIALKNSLQEFPDSHFREETLFLILKSSFIYAQNSVEEKKKERMADTINEYYTFSGEFPNSTYINEAKKIYNQASEIVKK
ncbi:MAG TPA: outer membrane protein assembly factor BamD [Bacteroidales bacterium]|nr:outer membrane protein assembly factor BamD [Bacteroidales bacterium]HNV95776.1 outer membrane protein assembly factor BamD [Bacteroidales bacterium]HOU97935.1 outer membrane protein assembly factor BamD [Bacteroidales bacterium]